MYKTLQDYVGNTPLVRLVRIPGADNEARGNVTLTTDRPSQPTISIPVAAFVMKTSP